MDNAETLATLCTRDARGRQAIKKRVQKIKTKTSRNHQKKTQQKR